MTNPLSGPDFFSVQIVGDHFTLYTIVPSNGVDPDDEQRILDMAVECLRENDGLDLSSARIQEFDIGVVFQ